MADFSPSMLMAMSPSQAITSGTYGMDPDLQNLEMRRRMALGLTAQPRTPTNSTWEALNRVLAPALGVLANNDVNATLAKYAQGASGELSDASNSDDPVKAIAGSSNPLVRAMVAPLAQAKIQSRLEESRYLAVQNKQRLPDGSIAPIPGAPGTVETLSKAESRGSAEGGLRARLIEQLVPRGLTLDDQGNIIPHNPDVVGATEGTIAAASAPGKGVEAKAVAHGTAAGENAPDIAPLKANVAGQVAHSTAVGENQPDVGALKGNVAQNVAHGTAAGANAPDIAPLKANVAGQVAHSTAVGENQPDVADAEARKSGLIAGSEATAKVVPETLGNIFREAAIPRAVTPTERITTGIQALPQPIQDAWSTLLQHYQVGGQGSGIRPPGLQPMPSGAAPTPTLIGPTQEPQPPALNAPEAGAMLPPVSTGAASPPPVSTGAAPPAMTPGNIPAAMTPQQFEANTELGREFATTGLKQYQAANQTLGSLGLMNSTIDNLNQNGWSSTGAGNPFVMDIAKTINGAGQRLGFKDSLFDPTKVSSWETLTKESTRAGQQLASSLGSREAAQVIESSTKAVPNARNTYLGARQVSSGIEQMLQRQKDLYNFKAEILDKGGSIINAEKEFNDAHPVDFYVKRALANAVPDQYVSRLGELSQGEQAKDALQQFDKRYGAGVGQFILDGNRTGLIGLPGAGSGQ